MEEKKTPATSTTDGARRLTSLIGPTVVIKGTITDANDMLTIKGTVEGEVEHDETLLIGEQGSLNAEIKAKNVVVKGRVNGNIHGEDRVRIETSGQVVGDIFAKRFSVEEGALMKGRVMMSSNAAPPREAADNSSNRNPDRELKAVENISERKDPKAPHIVPTSK